jgi:protein associated with RNAse G/E
MGKYPYQYTEKCMKFSKRKYGNKKLVVNGVSFDSKLEFYCYSMLKEMNFDFDFQEKIILVDKFRYQDKAIRAITLTVDFVIRHNGMNIYLDTKGFATEVAKIKYKMLKNKLKDDSSTNVVWVTTQKKVKEYLIKLKTNGNS